MAPGQLEEQEPCSETCLRGRFSVFAPSALCHPEHTHPSGGSWLFTALSRDGNGVAGEPSCLAGVLGAARHQE